ncbi:zinc finger protein 76-like isoform X2 [Gigantopelta aegis]|uniref:zinc finger protein 76-like isoform X2 n=1 Tax=Gigantopelta aegis TaxID=1735272 RepID=UPI001B889C9A|nr:zinc finger protein 76-like isoform X2 [Gigantopelta aegis]
MDGILDSDLPEVDDNVNHDGVSPLANSDDVIPGNEQHVLPITPEGDGLSTEHDAPLGPGTNGMSQAHQDGMSPLVPDDDGISATNHEDVSPITSDSHGISHLTDHNSVSTLAARDNGMSNADRVDVLPLTSEANGMSNADHNDMSPLTAGAEGMSSGAQQSGHISVLPLEATGDVCEGVPGQNVLACLSAADNATEIKEENTDGERMGLSLGENVPLPTSETQVVGLLLQSAENTQAFPDNNPSHPVSMSLPDGNIVTMANGHVVQAVTLADGTTAFIQHPKANEKFLEGQTLTLEDGSTAVVQGDTPKSESVSKLIAGQAIQLEDGSTAYLQTTPKAALDQGLQAITLEDGTTAFIAHPNPEAIFADGSGLENGTLNLEQLTSQANSPSVYRVTGDKGIEGKAYKCGYEGCGRMYTTLHHLKVHERSHTGDRPFKCEFETCGKAFATGYGLKSHTRVHTGEKPYKCPEDPCDKAFKTSGDLQKHVRTHTGEKPFKCPFEECNRSFTTSNIRKVHIRTHTGERPYVCQAEGCNRAFASATNYKNHIRIHTGEKPYVCTVQGCGKRFTEYSSLYKHHVVHTHSKPYSCNHCGKTYRQTSTLAMHKRTIHGEEVSQESESQIFQAQAALQGVEGSEEPPEKRIRLQLLTSADGSTVTTEEGDGTLVINTSDAQQTSASVAMVEAVGANTSGIGVVTLPAPTLQQLQEAHGITSITVGDLQGRQVLVVTDPSQLEALQQLAQQQHRFNTQAVSAETVTEETNSDSTSTSEQAMIMFQTE